MTTNPLSGSLCFPSGILCQWCCDVCCFFHDLSTESWSLLMHLPKSLGLRYIFDFYLVFYPLTHSLVSLASFPFILLCKMLAMHHAAAFCLSNGNWGGREEEESSHGKNWKRTCKFPLAIQVTSCPQSKSETDPPVHRNTGAEITPGPLCTRGS